MWDIGGGCFFSHSENEYLQSVATHRLPQQHGMCFCLLKFYSYCKCSWQLHCEPHNCFIYVSPPTFIRYITNERLLHGDMNHFLKPWTFWAVLKEETFKTPFRSIKRENAAVTYLQWGADLVWLGNSAAGNMSRSVITDYCCVKPVAFVPYQCLQQRNTAGLSVSECETFISGGSPD